MTEEYEDTPSHDPGRSDRLYRRTRKENCRTSSSPRRTGGRLKVETLSESGLQSARDNVTGAAVSQTSLADDVACLRQILARQIDLRSFGA